MATLRQIIAATHNGAARNFFLSDQFALPPDWNAIILARKVGIGPVGVRPLAKSELPP
jgi:hypothetical protein